LIIGGRLGIGRETGVFEGVGVSIGVSIGAGGAVVVKTGVVFGVRIILGLTLRRDPGGGLIGRTASKYWVRPSPARVGVFVSAADGADVGVSLGCTVAVALTDGDGVIDGSGVAVAEDVGVSFADSEIDGVTVGTGEALFFFRGFGVGDGLTKSFLNLSPNVSSCSSVPRTTPILIATVITITNTKRSFVFTFSPPVPRAQLDSFGCRPPDFPAENFH
jgi:hypothetical protein